MIMGTIITITTTSIATIPTITTATSMLMTTSESVGAGDLAEGEAAALYRLMTWLSPAFPVGGFSYSSGIEWAVEAGDIVDTATLADWLDAMLGDGSGFCDATLLVHAYRAAEMGEDATLSDIAELAAAIVPSRERQG
ncbi:urease accessory protein UreF, partial [Bradyrhizobium genomosp. III]|uniref:urease accessory protein UreF n=1 Tax=Bradyrhizobium genomosp. III TaxID=2683271 RepID=UPI0024C0804F